MNKLIFCALLMGSQFVLAQDSSLQNSDLDYYLHQALNAGTAQQRLALNHIGIQGRVEAEGYRITAVLENYPAQHAGIFRGDIILDANGDSFHPVFSFNDANAAPDRFAAQPDPVLLTIRRDTAELEISVSPVFENLFDSYRSASLSSVQQFSAGNKTVGYVRLWVLSSSSNDLISYQRLFEELRGTNGLILDVRDAVGFLDVEHLHLIYRGASAVEASSERTDLNEQSLQENASRYPYRNPVALLVNSRTRGGAEQLARQLDQLSAVITLGEATAGETDQGHQPEQYQAYPFEQAGRVDPQFQAAMDMLMGII